MKTLRVGVLLFLLVMLSPTVPVSAATIDGLFDQTGAVGHASTFNLTVLDRGGVPSSGVGAVALNVTVVSPTVGGYVTVWPTGQPQPNASNLNFTPGETIPNMVIVQVGAGGQISIFNSAGATHILVDVLGWFPTSASFNGLTPARLMDSRPAGSTVDGAFAGGGALGAGATSNLPVLNRGGVPAVGVGAVALNVTAVTPTAGGYVTVWPTGQAQPNASNLNFVPGQTIPNMVIVQVGAGGQISIFNFAGSTHILVDVLGWFPTGAAYTGLTPARIMDTRPTGSTVDGAFAAGGALGAAGTFNLTVLNRGGVPAVGVGAVALNVTVVSPTQGGYATVWPTGQPQPNASNLNFTPGQTIPNMVIVQVGAGGQVSIFNSAGSTDVLVDVLGWFPTGASFTGLTPARLMDTRMGPTIQMIYAVPAGVAPVAGRTHALEHDVEEVQDWFDTQTVGGKHPVFNRTSGSNGIISVIQVNLGRTQAQLMALCQFCDSTIIDEINALVPSTVGQALVIHLEGTDSSSSCGYSQGSHVMIAMGNCAIYPSLSDVWPSGGTYLLAHELTHLLGAVDICAPHSDGTGHVNDDNRDVLYAGPLSRDWDNLMLDPGHDDYYLSPCGDISGNQFWGTA